jgi:hypothetical protein
MGPSPKPQQLSSRRAKVSYAHAGSFARASQVPIENNGSTKKAMTKDPQEKSPGQGMADVLKGWTMVVLTFVFVLLYGAALFAGSSH